jgi:hypothetical protein
MQVASNPNIAVSEVHFAHRHESALAHGPGF